MRKNKYIYLYVVQGFYQFGYEDLSQSESYKESKNDLKAYRENERGIFRMIKRRELNN